MEIASYPGVGKEYEPHDGKLKWERKRSTRKVKRKKGEI
jgi:hypothetical protein